MARSFAGSAGSNLRIASALGISAPPLTLACWFKRSVTSTAGYLVSLTNGTGNNIQSTFHTAAGLFATESYNGATYGQANLSSNTTNWAHGTGAHQSDSGRVAHADGSQSAQQTTTVSAPTLSELCVAALHGSSGAYSSATVAAVAGWNALLTDSEIASLRAGFSPRRVRPQSLKFHIPLVRDLQEWSTASAFATSGGTVADHPRMYGF